VVYCSFSALLLPSLLVNMGTALPQSCWVNYVNISLSVHDNCVVIFMFIINIVQ
jgi:hypothetical protein